MIESRDFKALVAEYLEMRKKRDNLAAALFSITHYCELLAETKGFEYRRVLADRIAQARATLKADSAYKDENEQSIQRSTSGRTQDD